jgi:hypothetical protein
MPLTDNPEFLAWLARHHEHNRTLGKPPGNRADCETCGVPSDQQAILGDLCIVCFAGAFATDQAHQRIAAIVREYAAAVSDPDADVLCRLLASTLDRLEDAIADQAAQPA